MEQVNRKRVFLFAIVTLILVALIGIEAGTAVMGVLDHTLARGKTYFAGCLFREVGNERGSI